MLYGQHNAIAGLGIHLLSSVPTLFSSFVSSMDTLRTLSSLYSQSIGQSPFLLIRSRFGYTLRVYASGIRFGYTLRLSRFGFQVMDCSLWNKKASIERNRK